MIAEPKRASRRTLWSWMVFDWAVQPFHTLIVTFIFAPYFAASVAATPAEGQALWGWAAGLGGLASALLAPVLGAIADRTGRRKPWIAGFGLIGVSGCTMLFWAVPGGDASVAIALGGFAIGLIGFEFASNFYNAMMHELVPRRELGRLSGAGWGLGYVGGVLSLIIVLVFLSANPETGRTLAGLVPILGFDPATHEGDRASGPLTALWFLIFSLPLFLFVPDRAGMSAGWHSIVSGLKTLGQTLRELPRRTSYFAYLIASMLYRDGLGALYAFGGIYGVGVLGLTITQIGTFGIIAAINGALGSWLGGLADTRFGPKPVIAFSLTILIIACLAVISTTTDYVLFFMPITESSDLPVLVFYIAGVIIGGAGGAMQAASRTLLVDQADAERMTEAFGLYALSGRATAFVGPLAVAIMTSMTGSQQLGILPVVMLLGLGAICLVWVKQRQV